VSGVVRIEWQMARPLIRDISLRPDGVLDCFPRSRWCTHAYMWQMKFLGTSLKYRRRPGGRLFLGLDEPLFH
jgi:hypothetical protein